ncbi:hypothetical protein BDZ45DRAFT_741746 [Acephala macrosclerotiorum]|nr:hypothetical protein BDZ45DRAFT_741746 [Acephala macrosclerotiorum]
MITNTTTTSTSSDQQATRAQQTILFGAYMDFAQDSLYPSLGGLCPNADYTGKVCQFFSKLDHEATAKVKHVVFMPVTDDEHRVFSRFTGVVTYDLPMSDISMCWNGRNPSPTQRLVVRQLDFKE